MVRLPRFVLTGHPQHIIIRGNNREPVFSAEEDYHFFLDKLSQAAKKHQCDIHAYVLMTNHVHLLVTPHQENSIAKMMQSVGRHYVQYYNVTYRRTGTLWEGRYKASLIDSETYALLCYRYIELNPVRANMVQLPAEYPWSSYRANALGQADPLVTPHTMYHRLGNDETSRQVHYRCLFEAHIDELSLHQLREATNKAWVLGSEYFKQKIAQQLNRRIDKLPRGGDRKSEAFRRQR
ncbi:transposase [Methylobacillus caricis]|uniref:transposase n=1 Tax=Methylobacillus TaxID=404 RepID=UPI001D00094A|nr:MULTISPECIES: transposase [Methylobacillus]MCB5186967.1 transposase [Methylobacillus caricis]MCB5191278.1 transposase [Methylobacillus arboreus]